MMKEGSEVISVLEAAERLGLGKNAAYKAAAEGSIPTVRVGGRILVPIEALNKLLDTPNWKPPTVSPNGVRLLRRFSEEDDEIITNDYLNYVPTIEIAEKLHRSEGTIRQRILRLDLHRSSIVSKLLAWAPEHLRNNLKDMDTDEWVEACHMWRAQKQQDAKVEGAAQEEKVKNERLEQGLEIDQRPDLSRKQKMLAKRMIGMSLEEIGVSYGLLRERVRQITSQDYTPSIAAKNPAERLRRFEARTVRERERIVKESADRIFRIWQDAPPDVQKMFLTMVEAAKEPRE